MAKTEKAASSSITLQDDNDDVTLIHSQNYQQDTNGCSKMATKSASLEKASARVDIASSTKNLNSELKQQVDNGIIDSNEIVIQENNKGVAIREAERHSPMSHSSETTPIAQAMTVGDVSQKSMTTKPITKVRSSGSATVKGAVSHEANVLGGAGTEKATGNKPESSEVHDNTSATTNKRVRKKKEIFTLNTKLKYSNMNSYLSMQSTSEFDIERAYYAATRLYIRRVLVSKK